MEGKPSYLASLCFKESVYLEAPVYVNSETLEETESEEKNPAVLYVPKCLCIVSRQRYFNTLKVRFYYASANLIFRSITSR